MLYYQRKELKLQKENSKFSVVLCNFKIFLIRSIVRLSWSRRNKQRGRRLRRGRRSSKGRFYSPWTKFISVIGLVSVLEAKRDSARVCGSGFYRGLKSVEENPKLGEPSGRYNLTGTTCYGPWNRFWPDNDSSTSSQTWKSRLSSIYHRHAKQKDSKKPRLGRQFSFRFRKIFTCFAWSFF